MKISALTTGMSFKRALTTREKKEYEKVCNEARKELDLGKTSATIFDFSFPTKSHDTGIGTSFSKDAQEMAGFLKTMCGINSIQLQPQGEISNYVRSPYSGTSFSLGAHLIDLTKLTDEKYGKLLDKADLNSDYMNRTKWHDAVNYNNVFAKDGQKAMLKKAYAKFAKLDKNSPLKKEFNRFKDENSYWLENDALFEACAISNDSEDMSLWSERDKNIFATPQGDTERIEQLKQVTDNDGNNVVDYEEFVQFIADKQQKESREEFHKQGIEIYGDCLIGFSQKDYWAHKSAFYPNYEFGCEISPGKYSCWSPAVDFSKIDSEAGELIYNKFDKFFKRYDGVRIDAAWQFIHPLICEPYKHNGNDVFDENGNKMGRKVHNQPHVRKNGAHILKDIILKAADENGVKRDKIFLELLGGNSYDSLNVVKGTGTSLIHITRYGKDDWGRVKYYESSGDHYQGMQRGEYIIGPGTHDDLTLLEQVENAGNRAGYLANDLCLNEHELRQSRPKLAQAIFAELFTTKDQFATLPDILGSYQRINQPNTKEGNWTYRTNPNFEQDYFVKLSEGKGLNTPDALSKAIKAKNHGSDSALTQKLDYFANILRQKD